MESTAGKGNAFSNYKKLISLADHDWETAEIRKVAGLNVSIKNSNQMVDQHGRVFHHFCTTSYLGLDHHVTLGNERQSKLIQRYGGPTNWSQSLNSAAIGAGRASIKLHRTPEFALLQEKLQFNIQLFDALIRTEQHGSNMAIRLIHCGKATLANNVASELANLGFFTSAVFFPVVAQGQAAIRVTLRADMTATLIRQFCELVTELLSKHGRDPSN